MQTDDWYDCNFIVLEEGESEMSISKQWISTYQSRYKLKGWCKSSQTEPEPVIKPKAKSKKKHPRSSLDLHKHKQQAYRERRKRFEDVYGDMCDDMCDGDMDDDGFR